MKRLELKFVGIDGWNRPVFVSPVKNYYGSIEILFSRDATKEEVLKMVEGTELEYFGSKFGCEPMGGTIPADVQIEFI